MLCLRPLQTKAESNSKSSPSGWRDELKQTHEKCSWEGLWCFQSNVSPYSRSLKYAFSFFPAKTHFYLASGSSFTPSSPWCLLRLQQARLTPQTPNIYQHQGWSGSYLDPPHNLLRIPCSSISQPRLHFTISDLGELMTVFSVPIQRPSQNICNFCSV